MKKIMLVDDVEISNFIMKRMISKASPATKIFDYTYPVKALEVLSEINPDLIFLDLNMPAVDGWQFLEAMKKSTIMIPVYILTSSTSELDLQKSRNYKNVNDFLIKPITEIKINEILNNYYRKG